MSTGSGGRIFWEQPVTDFSFTDEWPSYPSKGRSGVARCLFKFDENEVYGIGESNFRVSEVGCSLTPGNGKSGQTGDIVPYLFATRAATEDILRGTADAMAPTDEWNKVEIRCKGRGIAFLLNDAEVNQMFFTRNRYIHCQIGFHHYNTEIRIRETRIKPLSPTTFSAAKSLDALQADTVWGGKQALSFKDKKKNHRFPEAFFHVLDRDLHTFAAVWRNPGNEEWKIVGTIKDGQIYCSADNVKGVDGNQLSNIKGSIKDKEITLSYSGKIFEGHRWNEFDGNVKLTPGR